MDSARTKRQDDQLHPRVTLVLGSYSVSGVSRMRMRLADELVRRGYYVDLVVLVGRGPPAGTLCPDVRVVTLQASRVMTSLVALRAYFRDVRPVAVVSAEDHANLVTILALRHLKSHPKLAVSMHVRPFVYSAPPWSKHFWMRRLISRTYPRADCIVAVSIGLAAEVTATFGFRAGAVRALPNPVVSREMLTADHSSVHPWLRSEDCPVLCGCGRLSPAKGFDTLIRGFAEVRKSRHCRLIIVGDGPERARLVELATELGVAGDLDMIRSSHAPHQYMAGAAVFIACSKWEGFGNVIVEAMACGTTVVATDCIHGPREILDGGRFGNLVPVGDHLAVARAIEEALSSPIDPGALKQRALDYSAEASAAAYLAALELGEEVNAGDTR